ncbi:uncharacterized protein [Aristolochia californica]|uniref:uncharacterized protein isoform X2 n=1 Tax=Aristolochia californica TaxID=171875 RepID=UPI0035E0931D
MFGGKSPGVTILWLWTIGTAAVLVTNVARTRLRDMESVLNQEQQQVSATPTEFVLEGDQS